MVLILKAHEGILKEVLVAFTVEIGTLYVKSDILTNN